MRSVARVRLLNRRLTRANGNATTLCMPSEPRGSDKSTEEVLVKARDLGAFEVLKGWRNELYTVFGVKFDC